MKRGFLPGDKLFDGRYQRGEVPDQARDDRLENWPHAERTGLMPRELASSRT